MLTVGLTGSIAVGKSFVCECFRDLGCHVLDADKTAREVVEPGSAGLGQIVRKFGRDILKPNGELDRKGLGAIVFADEAKRNLLNSIVHPLVMEAEDRWLTDHQRRDPKGMAMVDAALMIESGGYRRFDKIIVVWCEPAIQLTRLVRRDNLSQAEAETRVQAQMSQEEKKKFADYLIDTSLGFTKTRMQVNEIFGRLRTDTQQWNVTQRKTKQ